MTQQTPIKIALAGVPFSDNYGDLAIHRCLQGALREVAANAKLVSLDISGRTRLATDGGGSKRWLIQILVRLPPGLRPYAVRLQLRLGRQSRLKHYRRLLGGCNALLIGGGQLLQDNDANFPTKLADLIDIALEMHVPYAFIAVGVASRWSRSSRSKLGARMTRFPPRAVFVRDPQSQEAFASNFPAAGQAQFCPDPAIAARAHLPAAPVLAGRPKVGLNLLDVHDAATLAGRDSDYAQALRSGMVRLAREARRACEASNFELVIFTNGAGEDNVFVADVAAEAGCTPFFQAVHSLDQLTALISSLDRLVAFRLHASILAAAFGVPGVGLEWDAKVRAFYTLVGAEQQVVSMEQFVREDYPAKIVGRLMAIGPANRNRLKGHVAAHTSTFKQGLRACLAAITAG